MRVNIAQPSLSPPTSPPNANSSSLFPSSTKLRLHCSPSATLLPTSSLSRSKSTDLTTLRRSCSASFEGPLPIEDFTFKHNTQKLNFPSFRRSSPSSTTSSFRYSDSHVDVLEPSLLGIRPEPPDWPARDDVIRDCIARRASSIELPVSLRMIKMKQKLQRLEEEREIGDLEEHVKDNPISSLCCSTLYIIREVQNQALKSRGFVLDDGIVSKVQREMTSSFVWLFREVFAKTPDLMLEIMVLTSNFAANSIESLHPLEKTLENLRKIDEELVPTARNCGVGHSGVLTKESLEKMEEDERGLWDSMVEEARQIVGGGGYILNNEGLGFVDRHLVGDHDDKIEFVSPVGTEIEGDDYEEYHRTDFLYQMGLFQDPNHTLLLSNYAQFLCLVSRDCARYNFGSLSYLLFVLIEMLRSLLKWEYSLV